MLDYLTSDRRILVFGARESQVWVERLGIGVVVLGADGASLAQALPTLMDSGAECWRVMRASKGRSISSAAPRADGRWRCWT